MDFETSMLTIIKVMIRKYTLLLLLAVYACTSCNSSRRTIAIEEGWEMLGDMKVDFARDKDALQINSSTRYTAIKFKVEKREIKIRDLKIVFANMDKLEPSI